MSIRSNIGFVKANGTVKEIYAHWDGSPSLNGKILLKDYTDIKKVQKLIELGDISVLASEIGKKHNFKKPTKGWVVAYHRDRNEPRKDTKHCLHKSENDFWRKCNNEYTYLFKDGKWFVRDYEGIQKLTPAKCKEEN